MAVELLKYEIQHQRDCKFKTFDTLRFGRPSSDSFDSCSFQKTQHLHVLTVLTVLTVLPFVNQMPVL